MSDPIGARFIVGTSRCGSTLLSRMLSENPQVCSLFEFFSGIDPFFRFRADPVAGSELADRLAQDHPVLTMVLKRGHHVPEVVYPFGEPGARFDHGDAVPWSLGIALPRISSDPDALFDDMLRFVRSQPRQTLDRHYRGVLDWLCGRSGKEVWIERSGSSIDLLGDLKRCFPDARFVHLHRDGREAALSMREYTVLRLAVAIMNGALGDVEYSYQGLTDLERSDPEAVDRLIATRPPIELYGRYWSTMIEAGYAARSQIDPADILDVRFEDLVTRPAEVMRDIDAFLELPSSGDDWTRRACQLVKGLPPTRYQQLSAAEQERLDEACRPAMALVGRAY